MSQAGLVGADGLNGKSFPDLDMLPLGTITQPKEDEPDCSYLRYNKTKLKESEQRVLFTLWSISRSPLMFGGVATDLENDKFTLDLLTNEILLTMNSNSTNNRQIIGSYDVNTNLPEQVIWGADGMDDTYYVAFFNIGSVNDNDSVNMMIDFEALGINEKYQQCKYVEAWSNDKGMVENRIIEATVSVNDTKLYYLSECQ